MQISSDGIGIEKAFEGCLKKVPGKPGQFITYFCPAHVLTLGWGHTNDAPPHFKQGDIWFQDQCDAALVEDNKKFDAHVNRLAKRKLKQCQHDALVSWSMNTGGPSSSSVWTYVNNGNDKEAVERLKRWNKGGGRVLRGLVRRRDAESFLYLGDIEAAFRVAGVHRPEVDGARGDKSKPKPPVGEVAKKTKKESTAVAGTAVASGGSKYSGADYLIVGAFVVVTVVAIVFLVKKTKFVFDDWA